MNTISQSRDRPVKLAWHRENAKRLLRLSTSSPRNNFRPDSSGSSQSSSSEPTVPKVRGRGGGGGGRIRDRSTTFTQDVLRNRENKTPREECRSRGSSITTGSESDSPAMAFPLLPHERVVASASGITVSIGLTEPVLFLQGFDRHDAPADPKTCMLRGSLHLKITKPTKLKRVNLTFKGTSQTLWPDGVPGKKGQFQSTTNHLTHAWPFFDAQFDSAQYSYGADHIQFAGQKDSPSAKILSSKTPTSDIKKLALNHSTSRSWAKGELGATSPTVAQRGYKVFSPGDYMYDFELPFHSKLPETIKTDYGSVRYDLSVSVERAGAFRPNLAGIKEIRVVRIPGDGSLEHVEPIAISRAWEDQLHYDIIISGKSFPLGSKIPIAFKLTPLAKVACHRIKVYVSETTRLSMPEDEGHRLIGPKQLLLFDKRAGYPGVGAFPGSTQRFTAGGGTSENRRGDESGNRREANMLGDTSSEAGMGPTEMEFEVQLPSCSVMKTKEPLERLHYGTTCKQIEVGHWIKIVLRLSRYDETMPSKRRHYEISIDSPFHIMSCLASQSNICVPSYNTPSSFFTNEYECGCPDAPPTSPNQSLNPSFTPGSDSNNRNNDHSSSLAPPSLPTTARSSQMNGIDRPIHLIRIPSYGPPPFEDDPPPPPFATPPPDYTTLANGHADVSSEMFQDYFSRAGDDSDDDNARGTGRVDVPLTPGGRVHRSMDVSREWIPVDTLGQTST